jgi:hypothetical protein
VAFLSGMYFLTCVTHLERRARTDLWQPKSMIGHNADTRKVKLIVLGWSNSIRN